MKKVRLALLVALVVSLGIIIALWKAPLAGWMAGVALGIMIVAGFFSAAIVLLLIATLFRSKDDLWDTIYFRYMRAFWGEKWGGRGSPLQISVCRATWLSAIALFTWVLTVSWCGLFTWFFIVATAKSVGYLSGSFAHVVFFAWFFGIIVLMVLMRVVAIKDSFEYELCKLYKAGIITFFFFAIFFSVMTLIVIPIKYNGVGTYLIIAGAIVGTIAVICGIIWLIKVGFPKLADSLEKETVPGALISARVGGWKKKVCPLIIQKIPEYDGEK